MESKSKNPDHQDENIEEKVIIFPDGSIELDHSDITIESCSSVIEIYINHQLGFSYTIFLRDQSAKVLKSKSISESECSVNTRNVFLWTIEDIAPGTTFCMNGVCIHETGQMKPLCPSIRFSTPCTRPGHTPLLFHTRTRKEIKLKWKAARDNGKKITGYTVRMSNGYLKPLSESESMELPLLVIDHQDTLSCRAQKLGSGLYYAFQLTAYNECGDTSNTIQWFRTQPSVPNTPSHLRCVNQTNHSISLEWDPLKPEECNGSEIDSYVVQMNSGNNRGWDIVYTDKLCSTTVTNLTADTEYSFRLYAHNEEGNSQTTPAVSFATILGVSSAPVIQPPVAKKQTSNSIYVCWVSDEQFVNSIDNYRVTTTEQNGHQVSVIEVKELACRVKDLLPGVTYKVTVSAHTSFGWSNPSTPVSFTTLPTIPSISSPPIFEFQYANMLNKNIPSYYLNCLLTWEPAKDNGSPITSYLIQFQSDPSGYAAQKQRILSQAPSQASEEMKVGDRCSAMDCEGWIESINDLVCVLLDGQTAFQRLPVESVQLLPFPQQPAPKKSSYIPMEDSLLKYNPNPVIHQVYSNKENWITVLTIDPHLNTATIENLLPDTDYVVRVVPTNVVGNPSVVPSCTFHTPPGPLRRPPQPTLLSSSPTSLELSFAPISSYELRGNEISSLRFYLEGDTNHLGEVEQLYTGNSSSFTISGLKPACAYHFRVAYGASFGWSPLSEVVSFVTKPTVPEPPQNIRLAPLDPVYSPLTFLHITWDEPLCDNGSPVIRYHVEKAVGKNLSKLVYSEVEITTEKSCLLRGLTAGETYTIRVQSESALGVSNMSVPFTTTTGSMVPDPVPQPFLQKQPTSSHATIAWNEPTSNGSSILGYRILLMPSKQEYYVTGSITSFTFSKLREQSTYSVVVYASNSVGESEASEALEFSTTRKGISVPSMPAFLPFTQNNDSVVLHWKEPPERDSVLRYLLYQDGKLILEDKVMEYTFIPEKGRRYSFELKAENIVGQSRMSDPCDVFIPLPPVVKEVVKKRAPKDPNARQKTFSVAKNDAVDEILERKRRKSWLSQLWRDYSLLVYIFLLFMGIFILTRTTMNYTVCLTNSP